MNLPLDCARSFTCKYVVLSDVQADVLALWTAHTHALAAFDTTPYLDISSSEKRSGKTRLLEVLELQVRQPLWTANISDAALFRAVAEVRPTLLFDEVDAIFRSRDREDLRGLLNAGYRQGALVYRMGGKSNRTLESFDVFGAKAFAGIGDSLPDTVRDRAIGIRLLRRKRSEQVMRFRRRDAEVEAEALRGDLLAWLEPEIEWLRELRPNLPDELDDRAQDVWEPLLALAELAGGDWPQRAYRAALALSTGELREDESLTAKLLADIQFAFASAGVEKLRSAELIERLATIEESPWGDWYGKTITPQGLSKLLKPYRIKTMEVWVDGGKARGYKLEQFTDAFERVLGGNPGRGGSFESTSVTAPTIPTTPTALGAIALPAQAADWEREYWARRNGAESAVPS